MDMQTIPIKESEYRALVKFIYETCGIALGDNKQELVKTRLGKRLRVLGLKSYSEYYQMVSGAQDDEELSLMLNAITTNFTSFYRESQHFDFMIKEGLPNIIKRKRAEGSTRLRAWCAAASTGEEPYTIALMLMENMALPSWDVKLLATDISTKVLTEAARGVYSFEKVKSVVPQLLDRYFDRVSGDKEMFYAVKPEVKNFITFRRLNLMDKVFPFRGPFDFIFCRNVMIYFDQPTQESVVTKLLNVLAPGGYLLIGHSENLPASFRGRVEILAPATYRKIA